MSRPAALSPYTRQLLTSALPVALQTLLMSSKAFVDVLLLGLVDADSVAAAGLAGRLILVVIVLLASLAAGGSYVSAQCAHTPEKLATTTTLTLGVTLAAALAALGLVGAGAPTLLGLSTHNEVLLSLAQRYLAIMNLTFPLIAVGAVMSGFLRIRLQARAVLLFSLVGVLVNVLATLVFIVLCGGGIAGAAWGAVLGTVTEVCLLTWRILPDRYRFWSLQHITPQRLGLILSQSLLTGLGSLTWALGAFVFYALLGRTGSDVLVILAILTPLEGLMLSFALGLSTASGIELGKCIPTEPHANIHAKAHLSLTLSLGVTLTLAALVALTHWQFPALLAGMVSSRSFDRFLLLMLLIVVLKSISIQLVNGIIRCGGDVRFCLLLDSCTQWGLILPSTWLLVTCGISGEGVYTVVLVEESIKIAIAAWRFKSDRWRRNLAAEYG